MNQNNQQPGSADLPPLPQAASIMEITDPDDVRRAKLVHGYTEEQFRQGQRDAIAAFMARSAAPAPKPANLEDAPESEQDWARVDPATAFHLIERHADNWADAGRMMEAWRKANTPASLPDVAMPEPHPDDIAVDRFAAAMKEKMAKSRAKGRGGWDDPAQCNVKTLQAMLTDHLAKGDPVDVGNFAMMLFSRDGRTCAVPEGFALVPTMYTTAMRNAWDSEPLSDDDDSDFAGSYAAMVAAAPKPGEMPQYVTCGACDGTGYYASDSTDICEDCNGAGEVEATNKEWS